jgi:hypothetical protein
VKKQLAAFQKIIKGEDDEDDEDGGLGVSYLFNEVVKSQDHLGDPIPFYTIFPYGRPSSKHGLNPQSKTLNDFITRYGYRPNPNKKFGITGTRRHFRQDARNAGGHGVDISSHMNQVCGHSDSVAHKHYEDPIVYQGRVASNMFSSAMDQDKVQISLANMQVVPAFDDPAFFKKNWPVQLNPLPSPTEFINQLTYPRL